MKFSKPCTSKSTVEARVKRADGRIINLGHVNGRFCWRAFLYQTGFQIERLGKWIQTKADKGAK